MSDGPYAPQGAQLHSVATMDAYTITCSAARRDPCRLLFPIFGVIVLFCGCTAKSDPERLASKFSFAAEKLQAQKSETLSALQTASTARAEAIAQEDFSFKSQETLQFVASWEEADVEVAELRLEITNTVQRCYELLDDLHARAEAINDEEIRGKTIEYVAERRREFEAAVQKTEQSIANMESMMSLGQDIIESLRIVGTANLVRGKIQELEIKQREALANFPDVEHIIEEGKRFLNLELGQDVIA